MCKVKDNLDVLKAIDVFGDFQKRFIISTDEPNVKKGDTVTLINSNCEFSYDNINNCFENNLYYYYIVDLELIDVDYSDFVLNKSNNGGKYAYATCKILKVHEKSY